VEAVSVVIPVYNAAQSLPELYRQLIPAMETLAGAFELVLVNDGSADESWDIVKDLAAKDARVKGINLSRNFGQHNALLCGIRAASYDVIVTMDDDLQHPVSEIKILLDKLSEGFDVVYGPPIQEQHGLGRDIASRLTKMALKSAMGVEVARHVCAFRAMRTHVRDAFADYRSPFVSVDVLLTWGTTKFTAVPVRHEPRQLGASNYTVRKLITHAFNMMTGFSAVPLQLASMTGFVFTAFGMVILLYVIARYLLEGSVVPGFVFLASIIAIFSGAQLFALGILGEYMARMHFRTMERPLYIVRETSGDEQNKS